MGRFSGIGKALGGFFKKKGSGVSSGVSGAVRSGISKEISNAEVNVTQNITNRMSPGGFSGGGMGGGIPPSGFSGGGFSGSGIGGGPSKWNRFKNGASSLGKGVKNMPDRVSGIFDWFWKIPILPWIVYIIFPIGLLIGLFNKIRTGRFYVNPYSTGSGMRLIFAILIIAPIILIGMLFFYSVGIQNIWAGLFGAKEAVKESASQAYGAYYSQLELAMGTRYASEVDEHSEDDLGVFLENVEPTQKYYVPSDPVIIWGTLRGKAIEKNILVDMGCNYQRGTSVSSIKKGRLTPKDKYLIANQQSNDFRCEFAQGTLSDGSRDVNSFKITADFNFQTMAYLPATFMDAEALMALKKTDPTRATALEVPPTSRHTSGPIKLGIGSKNFPLLVINERSTISQPFLGFSISNNWQGTMKNITQFSVLLPKGVSFASCDGIAQFVKSEKGSDEYFTNYTMAQDGIEYINKKITYGSEFVSQNVRCFLNFDQDIIFQDRNRLDPLALNVFAFLDYEYRIKKDIYVNMQPNYEGMVVKVTPEIVGVYDSPICTLEKRRGDGDLRSAKVTIKRRKEGQSNTSIVKQNLNAVCADNKCQYRLDYSALGLTDLKKGDTLICDFEAKLSTGAKSHVLGFIRILNHPPKLEKMYFDPKKPSVNNPVGCFAKIKDKDRDSMTNVNFKFFVNGNQYLRDGVCNKTAADTSICAATLESNNYVVNDIVECQVTVSDGQSTNVEKGGKRVTIYEISTSGNQNVPCQDGDGGINEQVSAIIKGVNFENLYVELGDQCENGKLKEYFCNNGYVDYQLFNCNCQDGVCIS